MLSSLQLKTLIDCCCRRKRFYYSLIKTSIDACMLRALRNDETCQLILCDVLEFELIDNTDMQQQIITTLQSTKSGRQQYEELCQRQLHLNELVSLNTGSGDNGLLMRTPSSSRVDHASWLYHRDRPTRISPNYWAVARLATSNVFHWPSRTSLAPVLNISSSCLHCAISISGPPR